MICEAKIEFLFIIDAILVDFIIMYYYHVAIN